jgi:hypothetical protein
MFHLDSVSGQTMHRRPEARSVLANVVVDGALNVPDLLEARTLGAQSQGLPELAEQFIEAGANLIPLVDSIDASTPAGLIRA